MRCCLVFLSRCAIIKDFSKVTLDNISSFQHFENYFVLYQYHTCHITLGSKNEQSYLFRWSLQQAIKTKENHCTLFPINSAQRLATNRQATTKSIYEIVEKLHVYTLFHDLPTSGTASVQGCVGAATTACSSGRWSMKQLVSGTSQRGRTSTSTLTPLTRSISWKHVKLKMRSILTSGGPTRTVQLYNQEYSYSFAKITATVICKFRPLKNKFIY